MTSTRWWWRAGLGLLVYAAAMALALALHDDPDPVTMGLVVALLVAAGALLLDASRAPTPHWRILADAPVGLGRSDPRTAAHLRMLEGHLTAAQVSPAVRDRLRTLTDQVLRARHGLEVDDPRAAALLGPELLAVLRPGDAPRRLAVAELERCLWRIEDL